MRRRRPQGNLLWLVLAGLVAVVFVTYTPVLNAGFVDIDDHKLILDKGPRFLNKPLEIYTRGFGRPHYKPVTYTTWMLEYRLAGEAPFLYHFNNLLLHICNVLLVFFLTMRVAERFEKIKPHVLPVAAFSALLFGVHPLHVESVAWVVERKDVLFTFFYLLGILGYVRYLNKGSVVALSLSVVAYFLSVMSKSPGITLPAVLLLLDYVWKRKPGWHLVVDKIGYGVVFIWALFAFGVVTRTSGEGSIGALLSSDKQLGDAENVKEMQGIYGRTVLSSMRAWLWYLHSWFPFKTAVGYPREAVIGVFGPFIHVFPILLAGAVALLIRLRKKYPILFFGHVFFLITLLPALLRLGLGVGIFLSDRYVYLPVLGLIWVLTAWIITLRESGIARMWLGYAALGIIAIVMAALTFGASKHWKNTEALWTNVIRKYPTVHYAFVNRGSYYRDQGDYQRALQDINRAMELKVEANTLNQRGLVYRQMGNPANAIPDYNRALEMEPDNIQAHINRGNAFLDMGRFRQAIEDYNYVIEAEPRNVKAIVNRAVAYSSLREYGPAQRDFELARKYRPRYAPLYLNWAIMSYEVGRFEQCIRAYETYLSFNPGDHQTYNDMGVVHMQMGDLQEAVEDFTQAIQIQPNPHYFRMRARAYEQMGNLEAARRDQQRAGG